MYSLRGIRHIRNESIIIIIIIIIVNDPVFIQSERVKVVS